MNARTRPLELTLLRAGAAGGALCSGLALAAAMMRVVPLALGDAPVGVTLPFARAVASVALEAALLVGWPVGWALGTFALCERGEGRVLALLGRPAWRSVLGAVPIAALFAAALALASLAGGRDASEPGRVAGELLAEAREACARSPVPRAVDVPLVGATWLCRGADARLVTAPFRGSEGASGPLVTAERVDVAPDAREIALDDAWLALGSGASRATAHVGHATFRLPPFVRASPLGPAWRACLLASSGAVAALLATWLVLVLASSHDVERSMGRFHALAIGASGPLGALALLRGLDRAGAPAAAFGALPLAALLATALVALLVKLLPRFLSAASH